MTVIRSLTAASARYTQRPALVCFPGAGGSSTFYRSWQDRKLTRQWSVVPFTLPGRDDKTDEPLIEDFDQLRNYVAGRIVEICGGRRYAMFGYSMGGLLAFTAACDVTAALGQIAEHVFVAGCSDPVTESQHRWNISGLDDARFLTELINRDESWSFLQYDTVLQELLLPRIRADCRVADTYRYSHEDILASPLSALTGSSDPQTPERTVRSWSNFCTAPVYFRQFSGSHGFMEKEMDGVVAYVNKVLAR